MDTKGRLYMRLFISSDIEGVTGIVNWNEADLDEGGFWYNYFRNQMTQEVSAACEGAREGGADYVIVKDAHDSGRNIVPTELPEGIFIHRGWGGDPFAMVEGLNDGFDALAFIGYHSASYGDGNPLAHTMSSLVDEIIINGSRASEFTINSYTAAMLGIPVIFLSGDAALCESAKEFVPGITTVATNIGKGAGATSLHPSEAVRLIREGTRSAMEKIGKDCLIELPAHFKTIIKYKGHQRAYKNSFYPGVKKIDEKTLEFESDDFYELLRLYHFVL